MKLIPTYTWAKNVRAVGISNKNFRNKPWAAGGILILCVIIAMLLANLPFTHQLYHDVLNTSLSMSIKSPTLSDGTHIIDWVFPRGMTVEKFINDILMVIFFFTVGLEIKREVVCGELSTPKKAMLPVIAAAGGMLFPALIYFLFNHGILHILRLERGASFVVLSAECGRFRAVPEPRLGCRHSQDSGPDPCLVHKSEVLLCIPGRDGKPFTHSGSVRLDKLQIEVCNGMAVDIDMCPKPVCGH